VPDRALGCVRAGALSHRHRACGQSRGRRPARCDRPAAAEGRLTMNDTVAAVLNIAGLHIDLPPGADRASAVTDLNLTIHRGEVVCLVGESGSGKSLSA